MTVIQRKVWIVRTLSDKNSDLSYVYHIAADSPAEALRILTAYLPEVVAEVSEVIRGEYAVIVEVT